MQGNAPETTWTAGTPALTTDGVQEPFKLPGLQPELSGDGAAGNSTQAVTCATLVGPTAPALVPAAACPAPSPPEDGRSFQAESLEPSSIQAAMPCRSLAPAGPLDGKKGKAKAKKGEPHTHTHTHMQLDHDSTTTCQVQQPLSTTPCTPRCCAGHALLPA
jgi:hypothetical protein